MKIAVIGGGAWGTAIARLLAQKGHAVSLWVYEKEVVRVIQETRENAVYLPGIVLPKTISPSQDLREVLEKARCILFVVPSAYARSVLAQMAPWVAPNVPIVSATKGIEAQGLCLIPEVIRETLQRETLDPIAVLSGPSFAREVALEHPTAVTLAATNHRLALRLSHLLSTPFFRLFLSRDLVGVSLGGAVKNVIALAAGGSDGLGFGFNTKSVLMTRGLSEIARLGLAMGADIRTFYGLSGLGDLFLTGSGPASRNRAVGEALGRGVPLSTILRDKKEVVEGIPTTKAAYALSKKYKVTMPIVQEVYRVLFEKKSPRQAVSDLMAQAGGREDPFSARRVESLEAKSGDRLG